MKIKVLVVEDTLSLNKSIVSMLEKEGYKAFGVTDYEAAKETFLEEKPHIILLDIMLPQGNGIDLIPFFRSYHDSRVIMLTALDNEESKRISYERGADDYLIKPFDLHEIIYKMNAIKRRIISSLKELQIGDITVMLDKHKLICREKEVFIQPSQMLFLKLLYEKHMENSFVKKGENKEWFSANVNESPRVQTLVARLRKNLTYIESELVEIETIYGKGYRLIIKSKKEKDI